MKLESETVKLESIKKMSNVSTQTDVESYIVYWNL